MEKENTAMIANQEDSNIAHSNNFAEAFTLSTKYLLQQKRMKFEGSGKPKRPAAATSDAWSQEHLQKEQKEKIKHEKIVKKKNLQEEKNEQLQKKITTENERNTIKN